MSVDQLEEAVANLGPEELHRFRSWLAEFDAAAWDRQFEADAANGSLNRLAQEALKAHDAGQSREL